jgi:hypothetical protein
MCVVCSAQCKIKLIKYNGWILSWRMSSYLHSLKTMGLGSIIFKEWRVTWTFSYTYRPWPIIQYYQAFYLYNLSRFTFLNKKSLNINYRLPIKEYYRICTLRHIRIEINHGSQNVFWVLTWIQRAIIDFLSSCEMCVVCCAQCKWTAHRRERLLIFCHRTASLKF